MIKDVMTVTDKCQACGKEFELGEIGDKINGKIVCLKCLPKKTVKKKIVIEKKVNGAKITKGTTKKKNEELDNNN